MKIIDLFLLNILININKCYQFDKNLIYLNNNNYDTMLKIDPNRKFIVFLFRETDCSKCIDYSKLFNDYYKKSKIKNIKKAVINCSKNSNLCSRFFIKKYPVLIFIEKEKYYKFSNLHNIENYLLFENNDYLNQEQEKLLDKDPTHFIYFKRFFHDSVKEFKIIYKSNNNFWKILCFILLFGFIFFNFMFFYYFFKLIFEKKNIKLKNN